MTDFEASWQLTRGRFCDAIKDLNQEQLNWRLHPATLTIGEMAIHVAGVEVSFATQLMQDEPAGFDAKIKSAAKDGTINDLPFPFSEAEINPDTVKEALERGRILVEPLIQNPDPVRSIQIQSALGPIIDGTGAFARLAYHAGYHHGQVHFIRSAPSFPSS